MEACHLQSFSITSLSLSVYLTSFTRGEKYGQSTIITIPASSFCVCELPPTAPESLKIAKRKTLFFSSLLFLLVVISYNHSSSCALQLWQAKMCSSLRMLLLLLLYKTIQGILPNTGRKKNEETTTTTTEYPWGDMLLTAEWIMYCIGCGGGTQH